MAKSDIEKRVLEGGFDQLPKLDVEQVRGMDRHRPVLQSLKDLFGLLAYSLRYWKQILFSTFLMILAGLLSSASVLMLAPILTLLLDANARTTPAPANPAGTFSLDLNSVGAWILAMMRSIGNVSDPVTILTLLCGMLIGIVLFRSICLFSGRWIAWSVQIKTFYQLQRRVFEHVLQQSMRFFHRNRVGSLISEIQTNVTAIVGPLQKIIADLLSQPFLLLVYFFLMFRTSPGLMLVTIAAAVLTAGLSHSIGDWLRNLKRSQLTQNALVTALMQEAFYGIRVVKAFNAETYEADRYGRKTMDYLRLEQKHMVGKFAEEPVMQFIGIITLSVVLVLGSSMVLRGTLSFQGLLMFLFVAQQSITPLAAIGSAISSTFSVLGAAERVIEILAEAPQVKDGTRSLEGFGNSIRYHGVNFDYGEGPVLKQIDFVLQAGQTVALVGPSGGGKSTFVDLLLRFYDPTSGRIEVDGEDIRRYTQASYRALFGIVPQETILFNDTVRNNIVYGHPEATDADVETAARIANADSFIRSLLKGYDTYIGDRGVRLSGGEHQRIAIARTILHKPPIIIFDEATSSLDNTSERLVQQAIDQVIQSRTAVVIAHRLSTIQKADRILVIDQGQIVEQGHHNELMNQGRLYRQLYDAQFAGVHPGE